MLKNLPKYVFTDSGLVALSALPLGLSSIGLYGLIVTSLGEVDLGVHFWMLVISFIPSIVVLFVLARLERQRASREFRRRARSDYRRNYREMKPINNGPSKLSSAPPAPQDSGGKITLFPGLTIEAGENPFRPVTDEAIDETLVRLAQAQQKLKREGR